MALCCSNINRHWFCRVVLQLPPCRGVVADQGPDAVVRETVPGGPGPVPELPVPELITELSQALSSAGQLEGANLLPGLIDDVLIRRGFNPTGFHLTLLPHGVIAHLEPATGDLLDRENALGELRNNPTPELLVAFAKALQQRGYASEANLTAAYALRKLAPNQVDLLRDSYLIQQKVLDTLSQLIRLDNPISPVQATIEPINLGESTEGS